MLSSFRGGAVPVGCAASPAPFLPCPFWCGAPLPHLGRQPHASAHPHSLLQRKTVSCRILIEDWESLKKSVQEEGPFHFLQYLLLRGIKAWLNQSLGSFSPLFYKQNILSWDTTRITFYSPVHKFM